MGVNHVQGANGEQYIDLREDTVTEDTLAEGYTAHNAAGEQIVGRMTSGGGGGEAVQEIEIVTCEFDITTMTISNFSRTYNEIVQFANTNKFCVLASKTIIGKSYGYLCGVSPYFGTASFQLFVWTDLGQDFMLYYFNVDVNADNSISVNPRVIQTTG